MQVSDVDKRLAQQAGRFWGEVAMRRYDYDRPWRLAAQVRTITRAQLLAFFDTYLAPEGAQRRRLTLTLTLTLVLALTLTRTRTRTRTRTLIRPS